MTARQITDQIVENKGTDGFLMLKGRVLWALKLLEKALQSGRESGVYWSRDTTCWRQMKAFGARVAFQEAQKK